MTWTGENQRVLNTRSDFYYFCIKHRRGVKTTKYMYTSNSQLFVIFGK